ncbi:MAG: LTA synthase family protein [Pseudomonadota bacterium]|nr:LTA synthase family protein [Pseudomonadota bacterium]
MSLKKRLLRAQVYWPAIFLSTLPILYVVRSRLVAAILLIPKEFKYYLVAPSEDIFIIGIASILFYIVFKPWLALLVTLLLVLLNIISVLFYIKMENPLTLDLISQVSNVLDLRTSISDQSSGRLLWLLFGLFAGYFTLIGGLSLIKDKLKVLFYPLCLLILGVGVAAVSADKKYQISTYNSFFQAFQRIGSEYPTKLEQVELELKHVPALLEYQEHLPVSSNLPKKNVVLIMLETASFNLGLDEEEFSKIMPFFSQLTKSKFSTFYKEHFTPWPFSSKSLYSAVCGYPPMLSSVIEFRIFPDGKCQGWLGPVSANGYSTAIFYSGDLKYDNMGKFFKSQGVNFIWDRTKANEKIYEGNSWGIDDEATYNAFADWAPSHQPFASIIIPINSHHPYWVPSGREIQKNSNPYLNAFAYQDLVLKNFFERLKSDGLLNNTVVIVTGDHGLLFQKSSQTGQLTKSTFHVPLLVFDQNKDTREPTVVDFPTSHMDLSGAILELTNSPGKYLVGHNLKTEKPVFLFYRTFDFLVQILSKKEGLVLYNVDQGKYQFSRKWGDPMTDKCEFASCEKSEQWLTNFYWTALKNEQKKND